MASLTSVTITALAGNELLFRSLSGDEVMGGVYTYQVQVLSKADIKPADALGQNLTVSVALSAGGERHFNGFVSRFTRVGKQDDFFVYRLLLRPWLWFLSRTADSRIFQRHSVPDIVKKVFRKQPVCPIGEALGEYPAREYVVQYRETDLNFVSRLLEREGIAFHFVHELGKHTLVLTDSSRKREPAPGYATIPLRQPTEAGDTECLTAWRVSQQIEPAAYVLKDFDYQKPKAPLVATLAPGATPELHVQGEIYDYPGGYTTTDEGNRVVAIRLEQIQTYYETIEAQGPVRGVGVGNVFGLTGPLALNDKGQYLVVRAHYEVRGHVPASAGVGAREAGFDCSITAISTQVPFRPARVTPTPIVQGPHTALVVGPEREVTRKDDIWTDELGRILVRFHWERVGALKPKDSERDQDDADNTKAPCWLRVAQSWAGPGWGFLFTPRIGQEVIVDFLEGDPDQPIVTGSVYNQDNRPAYLGEKKKTQSGIRTRSTPEGGPKNFNEIRFEDKKGSEEVFIQAEKDQLNNVKNNRTATVGASDSITVGGDRSVTVTGNLSVTVKGGGKSPIHSTQEVTGKYKLHATDCIDVEAPNYIKLTVGKTYIEITPTAITLHAQDGGEVKVTADIDAHANGKSKLYLDGDAKLTSPGLANVAGKTLIAHADEVATLEGTNVSVHGTADVTVNGGGATVTVHKSGVDAAGNEINLNS